MKQYITPMVIYQSTSSSTTFSGSCAVATTHDEYTCPVDITDTWGPTPDNAPRLLFTSGSNCNTFPESGAEVCYHVPTASANIFSS